MTTIDADVIRLFIAEAAFIAGSKRGQLGFDKTTKRALLHDNLAETLAMAWSDDTKQVLLDGIQTILGKKTFSGASVFNGAVTVNAQANLQKNVLFTGRSAIGDGYIDAATARLSPTDATDKNVIIVTPTTLNTDYFALSNKTDGQMIMFRNTSGSLIDAYIDNDKTGGIYLIPGFSTLGIWDATLDEWLLVT